MIMSISLLYWIFNTEFLRNTRNDLLIHVFFSRKERDINQNNSFTVYVYLEYSEVLNRRPLRENNQEAINRLSIGFISGKAIPLFVAAHWDQLSIVRSLVGHGVDVSVKSLDDDDACGQCSLSCLTPLYSYTSLQLPIITVMIHHIDRYLQSPKKPHVGDNLSL